MISGPLRPLQHPHRFGQPVAVGPRPRDRVQGWLEESGGVIAGIFLDVLRQRDERRAAIAGISIVATACGSDDMICSDG
jgi:hypothetical protein